MPRLIPTATARPLRRAIGVLVLAVLAAACGTGSAAPAPSPTDDAAAAWSVEQCEGEAPFWCITEDGEVLGAVEVATYPLETLPDLQAALVAGSVEQALREHAGDFVSWFRADRAATCGDAHRTEVVRMQPATVAGQPGLALTVSATSGGVEVERIAAWRYLAGSSLVVVVATATEEGACAGTDEAELRVADLRRGAGALDAWVADVELPALPDGEHTVRLLEVGEQQLVVDPALMLPADEPPGFAVVDEPRQELRVPRAAGMTASVIDCSTSACEPEAVAVEDLAAGTVTPFNGGAALFTVTVRRGAAVALAEAYLP